MPDLPETARETQMPLDWLRANYAMACVDRVKAKRSEYQTITRGLPARLTATGLPQTLAFLAADKGAGALVADHLAGWIASSDSPVRAAGGNWTSANGTAEGKGKKARAVWNELSRMRSMTALLLSEREAIAFAGTLKRFASAIIDEEKSPVPEAASADSGDVDANGMPAKNPIEAENG